MREIKLLQSEKLLDNKRKIEQKRVDFLQALEKEREENESKIVEEIAGKEEEARKEILEKHVTIYKKWLEETKQPQRTLSTIEDERQQKKRNELILISKM